MSDSREFTLTTSVNDKIIEKFYIRVSKGMEHYWAFLKKKPFKLTSKVDPFCFYEPGEVHFERGDTEMDAIARVARSLPVSRGTHTLTIEEKT